MAHTTGARATDLISSMGSSLDLEVVAAVACSVGSTLIRSALFGGKFRQEHEGRGNEEGQGIGDLHSPTLKDTGPRMPIEISSCTISTGWSGLLANFEGLVMHDSSWKRVEEECS